MTIIKLNAIDSTNAYLKHYVANNTASDFTVVSAKQQTHGVGQRGTQWLSNPYENLTFSVYKTFNNLGIDKQFYISKATSIAVYKTLLHFNLNNLAVKWPNDILSEDKKISGILIENSLKLNQIKHSIIGIGLNVNTKIFNHLPKATSMVLCSNVAFFDIDIVLNQLLTQLQVYFKVLNEGNYTLLNKIYDTVLFKNKQLCHFKLPNNTVFKATMLGVAENGQLIIKPLTGGQQTYNLKQIELLY